MTIRRLLLLPTLLATAGAAPSDGQPAQEEGPAGIAARLLGQPEDHLQVVAASWNGQATIFADYAITRTNEKGYKVETRELVALTRRLDRGWSRHAVTSAEEEGGTAEVAAIGFANADRDADRELIVLLKWPQVHYDYGGAFYEVRLFDTPRPGQPRLTYMKPASRHFGGIGCECDFRDERPSQTFRFKTIAAIKHELRRLGY